MPRSKLSSRKSLMRELNSVFQRYINDLISLVADLLRT